eukprot:gene9821-13214_t
MGAGCCSNTNNKNNSIEAVSNPQFNHEMRKSLANSILSETKNVIQDSVEPVNDSRHNSRTKSQTENIERILNTRKVSTNASLSAARISALKGGCFASSDKTWYAPSWKLQVFVSSTFTDTMNERNILLDQILPELRELGRSEGIEVVFIDMRYGVRDSNTADHLTWIACYNELMKCKEESNGLYFLSLQSYKYGYRPIPKYISMDAFNSKIKNCENEIIRSVGQEWYHLDENNVPPHYVLERLNGDNDNDFWKKALPVLRDALQDVFFDPTAQGCRDLRIDRSVTDWEATCAMSFESDLERCVWIRRVHNQGIVPDINQDPSELINDTKSSDLQAKLDDLLSRMVSTFKATPNSIIEKSIPIKLFVDNINGKSSVFVANELTSNYLLDWKESVSQLLKDDIYGIMGRMDSWKLNGDGVGLKGTELDDMLHHCRLAYEKSSDYVGQDHLIAEALNIINEPNRESDGNEHDNLLGISLSIVGVSGAGKTALMSKLAQLIYEYDVNNQNRPVIIRFCGTNSQSINAFLLLQSIIKQIRFIHGLQDIPITPYTYETCVEVFQSLMLNYPVILFIDSLDQLTDENQARSTLNFLSDLEIHLNSKIIVSCLPDERDTVTKKIIYWYGCDTCLRISNVPRVEVKRFEGNEEAIEQAKIIFVSLLANKSRCLSDEQLQFVMKQISVEPTALYLRLAARQAVNWKNSDGIERLNLIGSVKGLISQIFAELERDYGEILVKSMLAMITYARGGLNVNHLQDVLSLDEAVLDNVFQYSAPHIRRLPMHVLIRVLRAIEGLIVFKDNGKVSWYHRQLKETAEERYKDRKKNSHKLLGIYFGNIVDSSLLTSRLISSQPLLLIGDDEEVWFPNAKVNTSRCAEALYHLVENNQLIAAANEMCNLNNICGYIKSGQAFPLVSIALNLATKISTINEIDIKTKVQHFMKWLLMDMNEMIINPSYQIFATSGSQPQNSIARVTCEDLVYLHKTHKTWVPGDLKALTDNSWLRPTLMGGKLGFDSKLCSMRVEGAVNSVSFSPNGLLIASGSEDGCVRVWEGRTGELLSVMKGHSGAVSSVAFSPNDTLIVSGGSDPFALVWDTHTGEQIMKLDGIHQSPITTVGFSPDGMYIGTGSTDSHLVIWHTASDSVKVCSGHTSDITSLCFNPLGGFVATGSNDNSVRVWEYLTEEFRTLSASESYVTAISWSSNGKHLAIGSADHNCYVWDTQDWTLAKTLQKHTSWVVGICFSRDSRFIASSSFDYHAFIWNLSTGEMVYKLKGHTSFVYSVSFGQNDTTLVSGSDDNTLTIWDVSQLKNDVIDSSEPGFSGHYWCITSVTFSPNGQYFASSSGDSTVVIWNAKTGKMNQASVGAGDGDVFSATFSHDSKYMSAGCLDAKFRIWNTHNGTEFKTITASDSTFAMQFHPSNSNLIASGSKDSMITLWDIIQSKAIYSVR